MTTLPVDSDLSLVDDGPAYRAMLRLRPAPAAAAPMLPLALLVYAMRAILAAVAGILF